MYVRAKPPGPVFSAGVWKETRKDYSRKAAQWEEDSPVVWLVPAGCACDLVTDTVMVWHFQKACAEAQESSAAMGKVCLAHSRLQGPIATSGWARTQLNPHVRPVSHHMSLDCAPLSVIADCHASGWEHLLQEEPEACLCARLPAPFLTQANSQANEGGLFIFL